MKFTKKQLFEELKMGGRLKEIVHKKCTHKILW